MRQTRLLLSIDSSPKTSMIKSRSTSLIALCALLLTLLVPSAAAQTDEIDDARAQREKIRLEQQNLLRSMDPLLSNLDDLEKTIELVELARQEQEIELEATQERLRFAEQEIARVEAAIGLKRLDIEAQRGVVTRQAVEAYTQPGDDDLAQILSSTDFNQAGRRQAFLLSVNQSGADAVDDLRATQAELDDLLSRARSAQAAVLSAQAAEQQKLAEINQAAQELAVARANLNERLDREFFGESAALDTAYANISNEITALIAAEDRRLWEEEQARIQEQRRQEAALIAQQAAESGSSSGLVQLGQSAPAFSGQLGWPVQGTFTSGFGYRTHPISGAGRMHEGIDVSANTGTPISAAGSGTVIGAGNSGDGYGNKVLISHGDGLVTLYAHMNTINVRQGQAVSGGDTVGTVGSTGYSTGPHLHFEVRVNGVAYDPLSYLP